MKDQNLVSGSDCRQAVAADMLAFGSLLNQEFYYLRDNEHGTAFG